VHTDRQGNHQLFPPSATLLARRQGLGLCSTRSKVFAASSALDSSSESGGKHSPPAHGIIDKTTIAAVSLHLAATKVIATTIALLALLFTATIDTILTRLRAALRKSDAVAEHAAGASDSVFWHVYLQTQRSYSDATELLSRLAVALVTQLEFWGCRALVPAVLHLKHHRTHSSSLQLPSHQRLRSLSLRTLSTQSLLRAKADARQSAARSVLVNLIYYYKRTCFTELLGFTSKQFKY
jgi:hypothetical protein